MSTIKVSYLMNQASTNSNMTLDANNLTTITGNLAVTGVIQSNITANGAITANGSISDNLGGVRLIPVVNKSAYYSVTANDIGKIISITTGGVAFPNNVFNPGDNITIFNNSGSDQSIIANSAVSLYAAGTSNVTSKILAQRGLATAICIAANTFVISGGGLN